MPHFIIDCSSDVIKKHSAYRLIKLVYDQAERSGLFDQSVIKVRIIPFANFTVGNTQDDFIHIHAHIMEGRSQEQKAALSKSIVRELQDNFPGVPVISIEVRDIDRGGYANRLS